MHLSHVLMCQNEVISRSVHISRDLETKRTGESSTGWMTPDTRLSDKGSSYLHEEASQQSSSDVVGVGLGPKRGLRDRELDPVQGVDQLASDALSCRQGGMIQKTVLAPLLNT